MIMSCLCMKIELDNCNYCRLVKVNNSSLNMHFILSFILINSINCQISTSFWLHEYRLLEKYSPLLIQKGARQNNFIWDDLIYTYTCLFFSLRVNRNPIIYRNPTVFSQKITYRLQQKNMQQQFSNYQIQIKPENRCIN